MVSAMTSAMEVTITSLGERMDLHNNKLTAAVNSLSSTASNNLGKDGQDQRIRENPGRFGNVGEEKWGQPVADDVQNAVMLAFNQTISEDHLKKLLGQTNFSDNCKVAQAKLVNPVIFSKVSPAMRSTDIKLRYIQKDFSKLTACLIQLLARLPDVLRSNPNVNDIESKTEIQQIILNSLKLAGHGNQSINK